MFKHSSFGGGRGNSRSITFAQGKQGEFQAGVGQNQN
jgi:hypothetical protein